MSLPVWLKGDAQNAVISLHIQPGAKKTEIVGEHGTALKIRLAAPPVDGKANEALIAYLAEVLNIPKKRLELLTGSSSRSKRVQVLGLSVEAVDQGLKPHC